MQKTRRDIVTEFRGRGDEIRIYPLSFTEFYAAFDRDYDEWVGIMGMKYFLLNADIWSFKNNNILNINTNIKVHVLVKKASAWAFLCALLPYVVSILSLKMLLYLLYNFVYRNNLRGVL